MMSRDERSIFFYIVKGTLLARYLAATSTVT